MKCAHCQSPAVQRHDGNERRITCQVCGLDSHTAATLWTPGQRSGKTRNEFSKYMLEAAKDRIAKKHGLKGIEQVFVPLGGGPYVSYDDDQPISFGVGIDAENVRLQM